MKKLSDCAGIIIYPTLTKEGKIVYSVHYKGDGVWTNSEESLLSTIRQITMVKLFGDNYKTWQLGKGGWRKDTEECQKNN